MSLLLCNLRGQLRGVISGAGSPSVWNVLIPSLTRTPTHHFRLSSNVICPWIKLSHTPQGKLVTQLTLDDFGPVRSIG